MYTTFRIQNFRGFKDLELKDIARVNLIAGKNNVGKTALLEAISVHLGNYRILVSRSGEDWRRVDNPNFEIIFNGFDIDKKIILSGDLTVDLQPMLPGFLNELEISLVKSDGFTEDDVSERVFPNIYSPRPGRFDAPIETVDFLRFDRPEATPYFLFQYDQRVRGSGLYPRLKKFVFIRSRLMVSPDVNAKRFSELKRHRDTISLVKTLQIIESRLVNMDLLNDGIHADLDGMQQLLPLEIMGEGFERITSLILAISDAENGVLLIDEIENGLHYSVQQDIWKAIARAAEQFNVQVFATTHSREMIEAAHEAFKDTGEDDFRFFRLFRSQKSGEIDVVNYPPDSMEAALEMNLEVR